MIKQDQKEKVENRERQELYHQHAVLLEYLRQYVDSVIEKKIRNMKLKMHKDGKE